MPAYRISLVLKTNQNIAIFVWIFICVHFRWPQWTGNSTRRVSLRVHEGSFDWEIWILILKSGFRIWNRTWNPKTDFNAEISVFGFSFFPFNREIRKKIWRTVLKNSGLARARVSSKKDRCSREQFCESFFGFPNRMVKRKSMKSGFGFLNWNPPWGRISRR